MGSHTAIATSLLLVSPLLVAGCGGDGPGQGTGGASSGGSANAGGTGNGGAGAGANNGTGSTGTGSTGASTGSGGLSGTGAGAGNGGVSGTGASAGNGGVNGTGASAGNGGGDSSGGNGGTGGTGNVVDASDDFTVNVELASDVEASAPTTVGIVTWSLDGVMVSDAHIEFGPDENYGMTAPVDLEEADFRTLLLGMKPSTEYHFRVVAENGGTSYVSGDYTVQTGAVPDSVNVPEFEISDDAAREPGFIVASYWRGGGGGPGGGADFISVVFILDGDGDVVWWYDSGMNGVARARMSSDGQNMWMVEPSNQGAPIARVSMDTLDSQTYQDTVGSHDLTPVSGETMAFLDYGESDCDSVFEIDPSGTITEVFEGSDITSQCHANALRYSATEDVYTVSEVSSDIWVVNREGGLEWSLAERVEGGVSAWGGRNHGHHLLDDSFVVLANDGHSIDGGGGQYSTVIEYDLDGNEIFRFDADTYTANLGDVQRLPGGNSLMTVSNAGVIVEITPEGEVPLTITSDNGAFGYSLWRESLYGEPPDLGM